MGMTYQRGAVWWIKYYQNGVGMRESSHSTKESTAKKLLKLREGDIEHGLPVNPKLNRIRFDEAADDLETEYAVNGRRSRRARAADPIAPDSALRRPASGDDHNAGHQHVHSGQTG